MTKTGQLLLLAAVIVLLLAIVVVVLLLQMKRRRRLLRLRDKVIAEETEKYEAVPSTASRGARTKNYVARPPIRCVSWLATHALPP